MAIFHTEPSVITPARQSLTGARWQVVPQAAALPADIHPAIGQVLASRGVVTPAEFTNFMEAELSSLPDPLLLPDMTAAVAAVSDALARKVLIRIFGDYDTDGITATAVLVRALSKLGGVVDWYLPHRIDDGYGLNTDALDQALADGVALGITVDNGISAHTQLAHAQQIGLRMIVTDHHEPEGGIPPALAVLNPKRADSSYPFRELAGVGVAFTLLRAVCQAQGVSPQATTHFLDLVTLGTIADVAPLVGENRLLVRYGLQQLTPLSKKAGIVALLNASGVRERATTCGDVGFHIAPRLNAAGRVAHASAALRLLLTTDPAEADTLTQQLCEHNTARQEEEAHTLEEALSMVEALDLTHNKFILLSSPNWHAGVIGIVASRLVDKFHRPTALIAMQDGIGKGSARARAPFHLWEALEESSHLLRRFGGHRVAAGFEISEAQIPLLQETLQRIADRTLSDDDLLPLIEVDSWVDLADITTTFARDIERLAPFGMGNPTPLFAVSDAEVQSCMQRGQDSSHLSLILRSGPGARPVSAIWFRHGHLFPHLAIGDRIDAAFTVGLNTWQGITTAQLVIKDVMA